jgi:hypothetical protein
MKQTYKVVGVLLIFFMSTTTASAFFSSSHLLKGTLNADTSVFFLGKTSITAESNGYPMKHIINSSIVDDMNAFPLIGSSTISNLDSLLIAENIDITKASSLEELYIRYADHITQYSNVEITTENGLFLLGINQGTMRISSELPYAVTTFLPFEISPGVTTRFLLAATTLPITVHCSGEYTVLTGLSSTSIIRVRDAHGVTLWSGPSQNTYLLIQKKSFDVVQHPPISLFPLRASSSAGPLTLLLSPADPQDITLAPLIKNVTSMVQHLGYASSDILQTIDLFDTFIQSSSLITNGAMLLRHTNDTLTIDHTTHHSSSSGFACFTTLTVTNTGTADGPTIQGDCSLIFLGTHFYNPQAKHSQTGIAFPYELVILWVVALGIYLGIRVFLRPDVNEDRNKKMKRCTLLFNIVLLIISILLVDYEVNSLIGMSVGTALITQGFTMITGVFFIVELILWVLGYILLGFPIQLLVNSGLRLLGIRKGGSGIGRGIGALSVWVFTGVYLLLILNILISLIPLKTLFPIMG